MIALPRPLAAICLALLLFCGALAGAAMSARMIGLTEMEICADASGGGAAWILVDRQGGAVDPAPDCACCLATQLAVFLPPAPPLHRAEGAATPLGLPGAADQSFAPPLPALPPARAPPPLV
jgi:hypothetical protein